MVLIISKRGSTCSFKWNSPIQTTPSLRHKIGITHPSVVCVPVCLPLCLPVCMSYYESACKSMLSYFFCLSCRLNISPPAPLFPLPVRLSINLYICLSVSMCVSMYACLYVCMALFLFLYRYDVFLTGCVCLSLSFSRPLALSLSLPLVCLSAYFSVCVSVLPIYAIWFLSLSVQMYACLALALSLPLTNVSETPEDYMNNTDFGQCTSESLFSAI